MQNQEPRIAFGQEHAAAYDARFVKLAAMRDALHLLISAVLAGLPAEARILCVGAGTGAELIYLAQKFPQWRFTAVEPSAPMLEVCRRKAEECSITPRCVFHEGYLDSLPPSEAFDAATSLNVSHFILDPKARASFFRAIAERVCGERGLGLRHGFRNLPEPPQCLDAFDAGDRVFARAD